ncbi:MAG: hypothetical protein H6821_00925 [Planctomycetaceae bacterium]|nr:hypothetical protein [Planctomycetaceae bacterium]MCB9926200.1 hypothetical protein [Planctomycetaceae bacterium]
MFFRLMGRAVIGAIFGWFGGIVLCGITRLVIPRDVISESFWVAMLNVILYLTVITGAGFAAIKEKGKEEKGRGRNGG